jgi:DNA helicase-4
VVIITDGKQKSQFLCDIELSSPFKTLNWDDYPAPKFIGKYIYTQIMCTGSGAGTFAIKDIIKASRYKWQTTPLKCWKKTWLRDEFSLEAVQREPWCREAQGVIVSVLRDDEADEHYSVSKGELTRLFP